VSGPFSQEHSPETSLEHGPSTLFLPLRSTFLRVSPAFYPLLHTILKRKERLSHSLAWGSIPPAPVTHTYPGTHPRHTLPVFSAGAAYTLARLSRTRAR